MLIKENDVILFQGDSVTDCNRDRSDYYGLGEGYAKLVNDYIQETYPQHNIKVLNRGVSGDRIVDVAARLEEDCLALNPTWVSILIGINDTWRRYDQNDETTADAFETTYRDVLTRIKANTNAKIIICEPFLLPVNEEQPNWREDLDPKIEVAKKLAKEFRAIYVPFDVIFKKFLETETAEHFAGDGIHPTPIGHELMATTWMNALAIL